MIVPRQDWLARPHSMPRSLRPWLADKGSLTHRIKARCARFAVTPLRTEFAPALQDENALLGMSSLGIAYVRDVLLRCDGVPVVFAHSVAPAASLKGPWRAIGRLGSRPLGEALFSDPRIRRESLAWRRLRAGHPLFALAQGHSNGATTLWARRSVFRLGAHPLLVTEVFLPAIETL